MKTRKKWAEDLLGGDSINSAAEKSGVVQTTLNRQITTGKLTAETVIALARGYGKSPAVALIETGFLKHEDMGDYATFKRLSEATDDELISEVIRRVEGGSVAYDTTIVKTEDNENHAINYYKVPPGVNPLELIPDSDRELPPPERIAASTSRDPEEPYAE